ncbi:MAG TPA: STAS domain-containing protein [Aquihabitans sp.]|nr:STAS domain-containing protein [Aquihabitans sp.]
MGPSDLAVSSKVEGGTATIAVTGTIDLATAPRFDAAIDDALADGAACIVLDCAGLEFMDSTGISVLVRARARLAGTAARPVEVVDARPGIRRLLEVCGLRDLLAD